MALQAGHDLRGTRTPTLAEHLGNPLGFTLDAHGRPRGDLPCLHTDPEVFFPVGACRQVGGGDELPTKIALAKSFCARCPVRDGCLQWALDHHPDGVWGGTTEVERYAISGRWPRNSTRANRQGATT